VAEQTGATAASRETWMVTASGPGFVPMAMESVAASGDDAFSMLPPFEQAAVHASPKIKHCLQTAGFFAGIFAGIFAGFFDRYVMVPPGKWRYRLSSG
jgi:fructose-specific phosphotransferase system IIC component